MTENMPIPIYEPKHKIRIITAASLFDGHDASINLMRRILQASGAEVIHLGHDRSVEEVVNCAIQEDAQAIALTSYQGGHTEYFQYMVELLKEKNSSHIKIFGGGGGVILPSEIEYLTNIGVTKIFSPDDGRKMGLQGMINYILKTSDFPTGNNFQLNFENLKFTDTKYIARTISTAENYFDQYKLSFDQIKQRASEQHIPILGFTGTGGAGKSSLVDEIVRRFIIHSNDLRIGILSFDPTKKKTGGALLGDRIRMNSIKNPRVFMRSLATRQSNVSVSDFIDPAIDILKVSNFDLIILETSGIGQSSSEISEFANISIYVMTPEFGAPTQLEKIDMLDFADLVAINKFDKKGALDALNNVKKQFQRNKKLFDNSYETMPVFGTIASQFNDEGTNTLFKEIVSKIQQKFNFPFRIQEDLNSNKFNKNSFIPSNRVRYLSEIVETNRNYDKWSKEQAKIAEQIYSLKNSLEQIEQTQIPESEKNNAKITIQSLMNNVSNKLDKKNSQLIEEWEEVQKKYKNPIYSFQVRDKKIEIETFTKSISNVNIPKVSLPTYRSWGDILLWRLKENVPGEFPFTAGLFPFKRENEDPTRMFAGEGGPERTNKRFHYLSKNMPAKRLSTAFDSVTLYGQDPALRPDIYGKIGNSGVSICCLDDAKRLYSGFDLTSPTTSVSMTINGPAPILLAFFLNTAIDQQCEIYIKQNGWEQSIQNKLKELFKTSNFLIEKYRDKIPEGNDGLGLFLLGTTGDQVLPIEIYENIKKSTLSKVRGTVQADILKEDQAQNTCIFSTEFALKMMGDIQEFFIERHVRNFYSVSISGYHIAEAGANPITQLALTLSNGFTFVEYYLSRGMDINDFGPNLSFFFSNGLDPEYAVIGRVARRIWAKAMKLKYKANDRSQMLKYHIQTSGRSLHAQEIAFNDIRTTLQALYAIYDNCNSLHTNAYDEAVTTPTEESVRRAMAIQLIINKELGLNKNENTLQGSFIIEELTDLVEEAVYVEFERINDRGGVLGAMETMYQRNKIQEESMLYESLKHTGEIPIIGVNTFLDKNGSPTILPSEVIRATEEEKKMQIQSVENYHSKFKNESNRELLKLKSETIQNKNIFNTLMETVKYCTLGQITSAFKEVGGEYRRNM